MFTKALMKADPVIVVSLARDGDRQAERIASGRIVSQAMIDAQSCVLTNKYATRTERADVTCNKNSASGLRAKPTAKLHAFCASHPIY